MTVEKQPSVTVRLRIPEAAAGLQECLQRIHRGPWKLIQLRGRTLDSEAIDADDVDLLGTPGDVDQLINAAYEWMREGLCHFHVRTRSAGKTELVLFSLDGRHALTFDLWQELDQFDRGRRRLTCSAAWALIADCPGGIVRLPIEIEACIYIQHLACKRKDLSGDSAQLRLRDYSNALRSHGESELGELLEQVRQNPAQLAEAERVTLQRLQARLELQAVSSEVWSKIVRLWDSRLAAPRTTSMISVMGCDGAGKTTLAEAIAAQHPRSVQVFTGKHLYRKSLLYKLAVIFIRPIITRSRERFDEILAPWLYLRAAAAMRIKLLFRGKRLTLVDRSLVDFLYLDRKTDRPGFGRSRWLMNLVGCRVPTIHCCVSFENVMRRKQEMTSAGHAAYDRDMFLAHTQRVPTDYVGFNNDQTLVAAQAALARIITRLTADRFAITPAETKTPDTRIATRLAG